MAEGRPPFSSAGWRRGWGWGGRGENRDSPAPGKEVPYFVLRWCKNHGMSFFFFHLPVLKFPELFHLILIQVEKGVRSFALVFIISLRLKFYVLVGYLIYLSNSNVNNPKYGRGFFRNPASLRHSLCLAFPPLSMGYKVHPRLCPLNSLVAQYFC